MASSRSPASSETCCAETPSASAAGSELCCTLSESALAARRRELASGLATRIKRVEELDTGFVLEFERDAAQIRELADFIAFESGCCAFLDFDLEVKAGKDRVRLRLTGPAGTKEFLQRGLAGTDLSRSS